MNRSEMMLANMTIMSMLGNGVKLVGVGLNYDRVSGAKLSANACDSWPSMIAIEPPCLVDIYDSAGSLPRCCNEGVLVGSMIDLMEAIDSSIARDFG